MQISILGICIGKNSCSVVGVDDRGAVVFRRAMRRQTSMDFVEKLPRCVIAMEACCGAHHLGRLFAVSGHEVRLMSPEYVRPYVKEPKNDDRDAEGIAEAVSRPKMRFVELKSQEQLDIQTLYRFGQPGCGAHDLDQSAPCNSSGKRHRIRCRSREVRERSGRTTCRVKYHVVSAHPKPGPGVAGRMANARPED